MEDLYRSLISDTALMSRQFTGAMFDLANPEGLVLIYVSPDYTVTCSHPTRAGFLHSTPDITRKLCGRIDDGDDPCVSDVEDGCIIGTQLQAEQGHAGYFLAFMPGYSSQTVQMNMDFAELILSQAQLIYRLIEKNNKLHHLQLVNLTKRSAVLGADLVDSCS